MEFHWRTLLLIPCITIHVTCLRICEMHDQRVYCQCLFNERDQARRVVCNFGNNITGEDQVWSGFEEASMVQQMSLNSRNEGSLLSVPVKALEFTKQLELLVFTGNRLGTLRSYSFTNLDKLERLDLERNDVTGLQDHTFHNLPNLTTLVLSENIIKILPSNALQHLPKLRELFLDRNGLEEIADHAFQHLHGLEEMDLYSNKISHISSKTFVGLRTLRRLDLSRNSLVSLKDRIFRSSGNLEDLDLSRNRIAEITPHAFDGLRHLQKLNLKDNKLFNLQKTVFKGAPHLIQINLGDNKLVTLQKNILDPLVNASNAEFVIYLKGNPFECRCDMLWISGFVNSTKTQLESLGLKKELRSMKCSFGEHRKTSVSVMDLRREEMTCPDPPIVKPPAHVYHVPPQHKVVPYTAPTTTTTSTTTEDVNADDELPPQVLTPPVAAEVNHVEFRDGDDDKFDGVGITTARAPIVRATVKATGRKNELELSDAAESAEPKPKTAEKKIDNSNGAEVFAVSYLFFSVSLSFSFLHTYFKSFTA